MAFEFHSLNKIFESSIRKNWDRAALTNYRGVTIFYRDVARRIAKLQIAFEQCGLKPGDRIALCGRNQANWTVSFLATLTYGAVAVPIQREYKPGSIHNLVNHSESKVLFVDESIWEGLNPEEMPGVDVVVQMNNFKFLYAKTPALWQVREHMNESFGRKYPNNFTPDDLNYYEDSAEELCIINYTSGTSGFSKGVMIPYKAMYSNLETCYDLGPRLKPTSKVVATLPGSHMYGLMVDTVLNMAVGSHLHFLTRLPSPKVIMEAMDDVKPEFLAAVPLVVEKMYKQVAKPLVDRTKKIHRLPILDKMIVKRLRTDMDNSFGGNIKEVMIGGAALNPEVESCFKRIGFHYAIAYGLTENAPLLTYTHWEETRIGSCGKAVKNMTLRIDSPDPEHIPGEVQSYGPNNMLGYYKNPEATAAAFTEDGWFRTGDVGVMDKDGYLYLRGRYKCMILGPSGQNIYPEELEALIKNITYVADALVIKDEGVLVALVCPDLHLGDTDHLSTDQVKQRIREALPEVNREFPDFSKIARIEFMPEDFERTPKGSIKRYLYQRSGK